MFNIEVTIITRIAENRPTVNIFKERGCFLYPKTFMYIKFFINKWPKTINRNQMGTIFSSNFLSQLLKT